MAVIEQCSSSEDDQTTRNSTKSEASEQPNAPSDDPAADDEGFETASDGDVDAGGNRRDSDKEDEPSEEELKQKALDKANEAKAEGNKLFGAEQYEDALSKYMLALQIAPEVPASVEVRSMCHSNSAACLSKMGKCDDAIRECTKALELNPTYMKALVRRAELREKLEHYEEAIADLKKILELDPSNTQARRGIQRLEPLAAEKREKMKEEMMGKLKEMGNSVLGRFGMSLDNFKTVKDPNTGAMSISFQRQ